MEGSVNLLFSLPNYEASYYTYMIARPIGVLMHSLRDMQQDKLPDEILEVFEKGGEYQPYELIKKIL